MEEATWVADGVGVFEAVMEQLMLRSTRVSIKVVGRTRPIIFFMSLTFLSVLAVFSYYSV